MRKVMNRANYGTNRWKTLSDTNGFLLLIPNAVNLETGDTYGDDQNWSDVRILNGTGLNTYDDVGFISQLVQLYIQRDTNYNVDPQRIFVTGGSNGGLMTYTLLLYAPELFTAGAAFIANLPVNTSTTSTTVTESFLPYPNQTTPIMIMNGNKDRLMKWDGGNVPSQVGGTVRSAHATRDFWINANMASTTNVIYTTLPNHNWFDRCRIRSEYYLPDINRNPLAAPVQFFEMDGGGHNIPSRRGFFSIGMNLYNILIGGPSCHDVNGADIAYEFFISHSK
jgi:polyhydroxybutyrate depolymerase